MVAVGSRLVRKGILAPLAEDEILKVGDQLVLNGAFAVVKKGVAAPGEDKVTRLMMNMIPSNSIQRLGPFERRSSSFLVR